MALTMDMHALTCQSLALWQEMSHGWRDSLRCVTIKNLGGISKEMIKLIDNILMLSI